MSGRRERWNLDEAYYRLLNTFKELVINPKRETVKKWINKICKRAGITRESLGIIAGERAELYFDGSWHSVGYDTVSELAEKGTDVVAIEKEDVCEILSEWADIYGIALLNTRGHLTEYCKDIMTSADKLRGHIVLLTDYEYTGIKIASEAPMSVKWIGINEETLRFFHINRASVEIDAENQLNKKEVEELVINGRHSPDKDLHEKVGRIDVRFLNDANIDLDFLKSWRRVEINAVLAAVESERFFEYIIHKLKELYPTRDYNRAIDLPPKYEIDEYDILPPVVSQVFQRVQNIVNDATADEEDTIISEQEEVKGFLNVKERKKQNTERLAKVLAEDEAMKVVIAKFEELMRPGVLPEVKKIRRRRAKANPQRMVRTTATSKPI